jgi:hypothetical protein
MYSKMIPTLLITMYSTYSTQCTVRLLYPIPFSVFEGSRIPSKFKEEFNSRLPNPHVISFNIQSLVEAIETEFFCRIKPPFSGAGIHRRAVNTMIVFVFKNLKTICILSSRIDIFPRFVWPPKKSVVENNV